jgi:hypothetical protein
VQMRAVLTDYIISFQRVFKGSWASFICVKWSLTGKGLSGHFHPFSQFQSTITSGRQSNTQISFSGIVCLMKTIIMCQKFGIKHESSLFFKWNFLMIFG